MDYKFRGRIFKASETELAFAKYYLLLIMGVITTVYHLWFARTLGITMDLHLVVHLWTMFCIAIIFSFQPDISRDDGVIRYFSNYVVLPIEFILATFSSYYMFINFERLYVDALGVYSNTDVLIGGILIILVIDLGRRTFGKIISGVVVLGFIYGLTASIWPGALQTRSIPLESLIAGVTVQFTGLYDLIVQVSATYIIVFLIFAGFLESYGALEYFIKVGTNIGSKFQSGITQTAVIASMGMGSVNGSSAANAATTGAMTIPLMKEQGIKNDTAAGIEAVASSGGQILPPVMGAAAFLMVEILGESYINIISYALLPALVFYVSVAFAVLLITIKELNGGSKEVSTGKVDSKTKSPKTNNISMDSISIGSDSTLDVENLMSGSRKDNGLLQSAIEGMYLWIPLLILIYSLVILNLSALTGGLYAIIATIGSAQIQYLLTGDKYSNAMKLFLKDTIDGMRVGAQNSAGIAIAAAGLALFIEILGITGFTIRLTNQLVLLSGGALIILLLMAMIASILFGLGMPTAGAYLVTVLLIAPALTQAGLDIITAHFFVFYFAILSAITPPVAIAPIITSEIADASFISTSKKAIIIGAPLFLLPYIIVANPSLLFWDMQTSVVTLIFVVIAMGSISISLVNYFEGVVNILARFILFAIGVFILFIPAIIHDRPAMLLQSVGCLLVLTLLLLRKRGNNRSLS